MNRLVSLVLSLYVATLIYTNAFFVKQLVIGNAADQLFWNHLAIFLIILLPTHLLINKFVAGLGNRGASKHLRMILLSVALIGFVLSIFYHVIPLEPIYNLPEQVDKFFASEEMFTLWLLVPLLALFI